MMNTPLSQVPYLREQRQFPNEDVKALSNQVDHAYIDIANKVNQRIIGNYPVNVFSITGERWILTGSSTILQSLRRVYIFTAAGAINHGLDFNSVSKISPKSYGSFTDGTNWYGMIFASNVAIAGQVSFYVTPTQIIVLSGGGAPAIVSGLIVLEYISNF
jgi:hypothetical protein